MFGFFKKKLCNRCIFLNVNCDYDSCEHYYIFQRVMDREGRVHAVELLSRPIRTSGKCIEYYFDTLNVEKAKKLLNHQLSNIVRNGKQLNLGAVKIFVNIDRYLLSDSNVVEMLSFSSKILKLEGIDLVYEITERQCEPRVDISSQFNLLLLDDVIFAADDYSFLKKTHEFLDGYGYIKIDMDDIYLESRVDYNKFVDRLYALKENNAKLIAEKVQSEVDFLSIYPMPFDYYQGFYFDVK